MRFSNLTLLMLFFLCSCGGRQFYQPEETQEQLSPHQEELPVYGTPYDRLADNVRIKQSDAFGITYEYKDVRIDGFRKGNVPKDIYIKKFGIESLFMDAADYALEKLYSNMHGGI